MFIKTDIRNDNKFWILFFSLYFFMTMYKSSVKQEYLDSFLFATFKFIKKNICKT